MLLKSSTTHGVVFGRGTGGSANAVLADPITSACDGLVCWERTDVVNKKTARIDVATTDLRRIERRFVFIALILVLVIVNFVGQSPTQPKQSMKPSPPLLHPVRLNRDACFKGRVVYL